MRPEKEETRCAKMVDDGPDSMLGSPRLRVLCFCLACDGVWKEEIKKIYKMHPLRHVRPCKQLSIVKEARARVMTSINEMVI